MDSWRYDVCIIGGCGHVGLPLGLALAKSGKRVVLYDINKNSIGSVLDKKMPFREEGAQDVLEQVVDSGHLTATSDSIVITGSEIVITVIGTPVDEHLNPRYHDVLNAIEDIRPHVSSGQLLVLRSTLFPGLTEQIARRLSVAGVDIDVAFCPERILEGHALKELRELPQIVSGTSPRAVERASSLFKSLTETIIVLEPKEAELAKLMTNVARYINFAVANEFYKILEESDLNADNVFSAMTQDYPRLKSLSRPGFAAGPCLFKDTMQLAAYTGTFDLGHAAMRVNESLPNFIVDQLKGQYDLSSMTVAVLGMAFKADNDDPRESLSYKLRKVLMLEAREVLCTDPYITDNRFVSLETAIAKADLIVVGTWHKIYHGVDFGSTPVHNIWNTRKELS